MHRAAVNYCRLAGLAGTEVVGFGAGGKGEYIDCRSKKKCKDRRAAGARRTQQRHAEVLGYSEHPEGVVDEENLSWRGQQRQVFVRGVQRILRTSVELKQPEKQM